MSKRSRPQRDFEQTLTECADALTAATKLAAAARRQADEQDSPRLVAGLKRRLGLHSPQEGSDVAENQIRGYVEGLRDLHHGLRPMTRSQLERDVAFVAKLVLKIAEVTDTALGQAARHGRDEQGRDARQLSDFVRSEVQKTLEVITPPAAAPATRGGQTPSPSASLLPPAASAFAEGRASRGQVAREVQRHAERRWAQTMRSAGVNKALPALTAEAGGDALEAARIVGRSLKGVSLGTTLDPVTRKPKGPAVLDPTHTTLALGASGIGKTTGLVAPYAAQRAALGDNVVIVTPQSGTIELILPTAKALSGQSHVPVIDFGGEIIGPQSSEFRAWDVTGNCLTEAGAMAFADAFAGPKVPARAELTNSEYWGGIVWDMYAAAGHIAAGMRDLNGLDPHGLNGMARVYDFLKAPSPRDLPEQLPAELRAALEGSSDRLRAQETLFREARERAESFHPRLRRLALQEHFLQAAGVPLSDEIVGEKLESLSEVLREVSKSKTGDPMESLLGSFKRAVPPHERLVMSPRSGDAEVDPKDLVRPGAGVSFVAYAHLGTAGLAAGAFTSQVLDEAIKQNKDAAMLRSMGGVPAEAQLSIVVDEGGAGRYIPRLPEVVTDTRQMGISAFVSMTSEHHLQQVFGPADAGKFLQAPCVIDLSPDSSKATALAPLFGQRVVQRRSASSGLSGPNVTYSDQKENVLEAGDVAGIPRGQGWVVYPPDPNGERVKLVQLDQFKDPSTVVGAAAKYVRERPEQFEPMSDVLHRFRPDLSKVQSLQRHPEAALMEGSAESVAAALADPVGPSQAIEPAVVTPARPAEVRPASAPPVDERAQPAPTGRSHERVGAERDRPEVRPDHEHRPEPEPEHRPEVRPEPEPEVLAESGPSNAEPAGRPVEVQREPAPAASPIEDQPEAEVPILPSEQEGQSPAPSPEIRPEVPGPMPIRPETEPPA